MLTTTKTDADRPVRPSLWRRARGLAASTPADRNRYADFLRAISILVVVVGHWLIAAVVVTSEGIGADNMLRVAPWSQWLTWGLQVMPIFFLVGGFSNGASWASARRRGATYSSWLAARLRRLIGPVVPLLVVWAAMAAAATLGGVDPALIKTGSQAALIPLWFLAVYVGVVALVPVSHGLWERFGWSSFALLLGAAAVVDLVALQWYPAIGWFNFAFVWLAVHQLGYAWRAGAFASPGRALLLGAIGLAGLVLAVTVGPYAVSMVGVPGAEASNNSPPTIALLALGLWQTGLVLALERPMRRLLERPAAWTATIAVNGMIMSVYLWHLTVMVGVLGLAALAGGGGIFALDPGSAAWWATRPVWIGGLTLLLAPVVAGVARFERPAGRRAPVGLGRATAALAGITIGLALLASSGIGAGHPLGVDPLAVGLPIAGAALLGALPRWSTRNR